MNLTTSYRIISIKEIKEAGCKEMEERGYPTLYCLSPFGIPFSRVNIMGFVVNIYVREDEKYGFLVVDDGTEEIRVKLFSDAHILKEFRKGDLVEVLGRVREYEGERYIGPDKLVKVDNLNLFVLRKLEILKIRKLFLNLKEQLKNKSEEEKRNMLEKEFLLTNNDIELMVREEEIEETSEEGKEDIVMVKKEVLEFLRENDNGEGVEYVEIMKSLSYPEEVIEKAIAELMIEGTCYEPKAGRMKILD